MFSGLLEKLPNLKIITHHCGGMLPYFAGRAESLWAQLGSRSADGSEADVLKRLSKAPIDYFKMFYGDTVLGGRDSERDVRVPLVRPHVADEAAHPPRRLLLAQACPLLALRAGPLGPRSLLGGLPASRRSLRFARAFRRRV